MAEDLIWEGNVQLLEHEQRALVQPNFDRLSGAFARLFSMGSTTELRGAWTAAGNFPTSPRSISTRSHAGSRGLFAHRRGRGSHASTTAGVGS